MDTSSLVAGTDIMSTSSEASGLGAGLSSGGRLGALRFKGDADRGRSSGRDIFRFLIVEDVVKGSCLCSSRATDYGGPLRTRVSLGGRASLWSTFP